MLLRRLDDLKAFVTKDESTIREFFHPLHETSEKAPKNIGFSIALATVKPGRRTLEHIHEASAEFYYITRGIGVIHLDFREKPLEQNTLVCIPAKTRHTVTNTGKEDLLILCICQPPYSHEDTKIVE